MRKCCKREGNWLRSKGFSPPQKARQPSSARANLPPPDGSRRRKPWCSLIPAAATNTRKHGSALCCRDRASARRAEGTVLAGLKPDTYIYYDDSTALLR